MAPRQARFGRRKPEAAILNADDTNEPRTSLVLLTGATGYIGGRLLRLLATFRLPLPERGADIHGRIELDPAFADAGGPYASYQRERSKKLVVKIPSGVRTGQRIRLAGMGHMGKAGGEPGDLFLEVRLHRSFPQRLMRVLHKLFKTNH